MEKFVVGIIRGSHGLTGSCKVESTSGEYEHFSDIKEVTLRNNGSEKKCNVENVSFGDRILYVKFSGINTPEEAKRYSSWEVLVPRENACPCGKDEYYIEDLKQCSLVYCGDKAKGLAGKTAPIVLGTITDVLEGGAGDLLEVVLSESCELLAENVCHDQAMVGDKTIAFRLMDAEMYTSMNKESQSPIVDRGMALHKMIRLVTLATCGNGYLTFMGNEFGHPEWIDFPREGNGWSYKHARRQWSLAEPDYLRYRYLRNFDKAMVELARKESILDDKPELFVQDEEKKILIFKRKNCIFALNFNPTSSFADYGFAVPAGKYVSVLNSDESEFDGFARIKTGEVHFSVPVKSENGNGKYNDSMSLYLPSRCAIVLKKVD